MSNVDKGLVKLVEPPGIRSTGRKDLEPHQRGDEVPGGVWTFLVGADGAPLVRNDFRDFLNSVTHEVRQLVLGDMDLVWKKAEAAQLTYGETKAEGQVCKMYIANGVLEIRLDEHISAIDDKGREFRLYFSEPNGEPGELLGLHLAYKSPGPMGLDEQDDHALEAQKRVDNWLLNRMVDRV